MLQSWNFGECGVLWECRLDYLSLLGNKSMRMISQYSKPEVESSTYSGNSCNDTVLGLAFLLNNISSMEWEDLMHWQLLVPDTILIRTALIFRCWSILSQDEWIPPIYSNGKYKKKKWIYCCWSIFSNSSNKTYGHSKHRHFLKYFYCFNCFFLLIVCFWRKINFNSLFLVLQ